jgi:hypothetical protein
MASRGLVNVSREMRRARSVNRTKKCTTVTVRQMTVAERDAMLNPPARKPELPRSTRPREDAPARPVSSRQFRMTF